MKRKLLSLLLAVSMTAGMLCAPAQADFTFTDDGTTGTWNWASTYIYKAYNRGIFKGDTAGNFNADASLTRAEAVTALLALKGVTVDTSVKVSGFDDADGHWYTPYVAAAKKEGMSAGYIEDGKSLFKPNDGITRAEFVTMLLSAMGVAVDKTVTESGFADSDGHWYTPYVAAAREEGLSAGYNEGGKTLFKPDKVIIRAEAATMAANVEINSDDPEPTETVPAETAPAETTPVETTPVETIPAETAPVETEPEDTALVHVGDRITLGSYEQDNDTADGTEAIEWRVLAVDGDKALVISEYALDCRPYNETGAAVTWETCTLRAWLNSDFYNTAFGTDEQDRILTTTVQNKSAYVGFNANANGSQLCNPTGEGMTSITYHSEGGNSTEDKIFLLSLDEMQTFFDCTAKNYTAEDHSAYTYYPDIQCVPTAYAIANNAEKGYSDVKETGGGCCYWWLRSSGRDAETAAYVTSAGLFTYPTAVDFTLFAVRPAMWVTIPEDIS